MKRFVKYGAQMGSYKAFLAGVFVFASTASAEPVDILALGDSLTQGYGLLEQEGFVPQLRDWLDARGYEVRLVNGGVSGDTTAGALARVEWSLTPEIDAMIVTLGGNDLLRGSAPSEARNNIEGILKVAQAHKLEVLLIGMQAPGNFGQDYKDAFDALYPDLAEEYETVFLPSFFDGFGLGTRSLADVAHLMQSDGIHPNAEGIKMIVTAVGPKVEELIRRVSD